jgi:hypothetical protein
MNKDFTLPHMGVWLLFDLIRHGLAHLYQQTIVKLNNDKHFYISLTGADYDRYLNVAANLQRPTKHLAYTFDDDGVEHLS